jgi:hypothetical protein
MQAGFFCCVDACVLVCLLACCLFVCLSVLQAALAKEVHWLTSLNHPNLVRFCAVCLERPLVVMEFYKVRPGSIK